MRIQKVSNENSLSVFDVLASQHQPLKDREPEMKQPTQKVADRSWAEESPAAKLEHNTPDEIDLARKANSIRSARCAPDGITNEGGSSVANTSGKNSIFDSEVLSRLADEQTNKEKTAEERASSAQLRSEKAAEWKAASQLQIGESEAEFMARNDSTIRSASTEQNRRQWVPQNSISMFDNADFERIQKSAGEEIEPRQYAKDDSWRQAKKASTFQQRQSDMVDGLSAEAQDNGYRNQHQDATDRLFDILKAQQED
jgi:hypothetical protein